jgi:hypothetical protein
VKLASELEVILLLKAEERLVADLTSEREIVPDLLTEDADSKERGPLHRHVVPGRGNYYRSWVACARADYGQ